MHLEKLVRANPNGISNARFKVLVKTQIVPQKKENLIEKASKYEKIVQEEFRKDSFSRKPYFSTSNLSDIRYRCRIDLKMVDKIRQNFSSKYRRKNLSLSCPSCKHYNNNTNDKNTSHTTNKFPDSQNHLLHQCPAFSHLHEELDIETDEGLIQFLKIVTETRLEEGDE